MINCRIRTKVKSAAIGLIAATLVSFTACGEGDFDQRLRGEIDQLRAEAFTDINSNPRTDPAATIPAVTGVVTTGGYVDLARVLLHPIADDGTVDLSDAALLGSSVSRLVSGLTSDGPPATKFSVTVRRPYAGAILIRVLPNVNGTTLATAANPASGLSNPRSVIENGQELWGYCPDFPNTGSAIVISPLTTLAVERAAWLGGLSSGMLSLASRQVGQSFGMKHARENQGSDLLSRSGGLPNAEAHDFANAAISQVAVDAGVTSLDVLGGLVYDIRDDGDLNGSIGLIPGSSMTLPAFSQSGFLGTVVLRDRWLLVDNTENLSAYRTANSWPGRELALDYLDTQRSLADYPQELVDVTQAYTEVAIAPGGKARLGLRGFTLVDQGLYLVASSDGPSVWIRNSSSSAPGVAALSADGQIEVSALATPGMNAVIGVRIRPDGTHLVGTFDRTFEIRVRVVAP